MQTIPNSRAALRCLFLLTLLGLLGVVGCDRNIEPYVPGEQPSEPDLSRIFPQPEEGEQAAQPMPGAGPSASPAAPAAGPVVSGRIELTDAAPSGGVLFIVARRAGAVGGPPLAVVRLASPSFPLDFEIGQGNVMIPSMKFEGEMSLTARLDFDGNAMTREPGDYEGAAADPVAPGMQGIVLVLERSS
jgi:cytochrome c-type biogenesis protein CcmH